ncbi:dihydroorotase [Rhizomonospora bruguierae]|uniref:dihydroorotase n=1 Tax=Rhizomonospora bruguierae TaxID=1581705 RepID=UPI001BCB2A8B|nr:dihydroorotase family protein [Micromonospora sp. NBRC 107566]
MLDKAINGGRVFISGRFLPLHIGISDGRIAVLSRDPLEAQKTVDARGRYVLPGAIDAHVHFRAPAHPEKEDFVSGTSAAVSGGVTTVFEMPLADVGTSTVERLVRRRNILSSEAICDFSLIAGIGGSNYESAEEIAAAGAIAFKTFTRPAFPGRETNFDGCLAADELDLIRIARKVKGAGIIWSIHAENHEIVDELAADFDFHADLPEQEVVNVHLASKDELSELDPLSRIIHVLRYTGAAAHIVHVTSERAIALIRSAQAEGIDITGEASLPNLMLVDEEVRRLGRLGLLSPAIRTETDRKSLWEAAGESEIVTFASDHASYSKVDVSRGWNGAEKPEVGGIAGVEHMVPLLLTESRRLTGGIELAVTRLTEGVARRYGVWPRKGSLLPGADADIALISETDTRIDETAMKSKAAWTVFHDRAVDYRVDETIVRGRTVYRDGEVVQSKGWGKYVNGPALSAERAATGKLDG